MNNKSYWIKDTKNKKIYPKLQEVRETDVCVIGGGLTGITTAYYLTKENTDCIVLECDEIASKSSGNSTGKITSQHGIFYKYLIDSEGEEFAQKYLDANEIALKNIAGIIKEENIDCDLKIEDNYVYTMDNNKIELFSEEYFILKKLGADVELLEEFKNNELNIPIQRAIKYKNQLQFNPREYALALADKIKNVFEHSKVIDIQKDKESDKYKVITEEGIVFATHVVLATRYPIISFPGMFFLKMYQSTSYGIAVETKSNIAGMYITDDIPTRSVRTAYKDNEKNLVLVIGEDHKTGEQKESEDPYLNLENWFKEIYNDAVVKYKWNTEDTISLDKIPYIGELSDLKPNIYVATGYKKWGISMSNIAANIIVDLINKRENPFIDIFYSKRMQLVKNREEVGNMIKEAADGFVINRLNIPKDTLDNINVEEGKVIEIDSKKVGVYKDIEGEFYFVKPFCKHLGCLLTFNTIEKTWDCPCHGSRYSFDGKCIYGPSVMDLDKEEI